MSTKSNNTGLFFFGVFVALGLAAAGFFIGQTLVNAKRAANTATVKGLAERRVKADLAVWEIAFTMESTRLEDAHQAAQEKRRIARQFFLDRGFTKQEMTLFSEADVAEYRNDGVLKERKFRVRTRIKLRTHQIDKVEQTRQQLSDLIAKGVVLDNSAPKYLYTKLNDIKPELLGEATKNARLAARQFAEDAGAKVGGIQNARQGSFSITAYDSAGSYSYTNETALYKKVRVVTTITFYLE